MREGSEGVLEGWMRLWRRECRFQSRASDRMDVRLLLFVSLIVLEFVGMMRVDQAISE